VAKLVHNCAGYGIQMVLAEVFSMGIKAGVEPLALWEAVRTGASGRQRTFDRLYDRFLPNKYDPPSFALKLGHKDMRLATELGRELGVPMRLANMAFAEMTEALNRGWENRDSRYSSSNAVASRSKLILSGLKKCSTAIHHTTAVQSVGEARRLEQQFFSRRPTEGTCCGKQASLQVSSRRSA